MIARRILKNQMRRFMIFGKPVFEKSTIRVAGRTLTTISVGDRFTKFMPTRDEQGRRVQDGPDRDVDLTVIQILSFRKLVQSVSADVSPLLILRGSQDGLSFDGDLISADPDADSGGISLG